ncbi:beta-ketoacyl reductase, partial [Kibdelosporangium lantanae]
MTEARSTGVSSVLRLAEFRALLVADIDWERFLPMASSVRATTLFDDIPDVVRLRQEDTADGAGRDVTFVDTMTALSEPDRRRKLTEVVRKQAAQVLGYRDGSLPDPESPFRDLGFDSAGSVEFRNRLVKLSGLALPTSLVFDYPSSTVLVDFLMDQLRQLRPNGATALLTRLREVRAELGELVSSAQ